MEVVEANTGVLPVEDRINEIQTLASDHLIMQEAGFLEVYINNEAQTPVYYDNFAVAATMSNVVEVNAYYPYGMIIPGLSLMAPPGKWNGYKYSAKELQTELGLNWGDHGARMADYTVGRWWVPDPLAEKRPWESTYSFCGNNPVNRIDPDGRKWKTTLDKEIAKQLQQKIANRDKSLANQEAKINDKIAKIEGNDKLSAEKKPQQIEKQQGKLENVQTQRNLLSNLDKGITQLGDSKTSYTFNTVDAGTLATLSSTEDGTIVINNYGTIGNQAHETTHAIQYDNGKISFRPLGSNNALMQNPQGLEIQAYATEYSITNGVVPYSTAKHPRTVFGISTQWLYGLKDQRTGTYIYRPENYKR
jgi:RHS repeat-associated protein